MIRRAAELRRLFFAFIGKMLRIGIWRKNDFDFVYATVIVLCIISNMIM